MIDKTFCELSGTIAQRKTDIQKLNSLIGCNRDGGSQDYEYYHMREQVRCSQQKINLLILKKQKIINSQIKHRCLQLVVQSVVREDPQLRVVFDPQADYRLVSYEALTELINLFCSKTRLPSDKTYSILRPNNQFIVQQFVALGIQDCRYMFRQALYTTYPPSFHQRNSISGDKTGSGRPHRTIRAKTQASQVNDYFDKNANDDINIRINKVKSLAATNFIVEHQEYLSQARKNFIQKFNEEEYKQKINTLYAQLRGLNQQNAGIIRTHFLKMTGSQQIYDTNTFKLHKNQLNLYTKSEKKQMVEKLKKQLQNQDKKVLNNPQSLPVSDRELKAFKKIYIETTTKKQKIIQKINGLVPPIVKQVNQWLPIRCIFVNNLESCLALKFSMETADQNLGLKEKLVAYLQGNQQQSNPNNEVKIQKNLRYKNEITGCFSRKKLKQFIDGPQLLQKKLNIRSNTNIELPQIASKNLRRNLVREPSLTKMSNKRELGPKVANALTWEIKKIIEGQDNTKISHQKLKSLKHSLSLRMSTFCDE